MSEGFLIFIATVVVAILIDVIKRRIDDHQREAAIVYLVRKEAENNLDALEENTLNLKRELKNFEAGSYHLMGPILAPLLTSAWDVVALNPPKRLQQGDVLIKLNRATTRAKRANAMMARNEEIRDAGRDPMSGYQHLISHNNHLLDWTAQQRIDWRALLVDL